MKKKKKLVIFIEPRSKKVNDFIVGTMQSIGLSPVDRHHTKLDTKGKEHQVWECELYFVQALILLRSKDFRFSIWVDAGNNRIKSGEWLAKKSKKKKEA